MTEAEFERLAERQGRLAAEIFKLREQADLYLMANDADSANRLLAVISRLESTRAKQS